MLTAAGIAWAFVHPDQSWEGWLVASLGAGVSLPEIIEGTRRMRR